MPEERKEKHGRATSLEHRVVGKLFATRSRQGHCQTVDSMDYDVREGCNVRAAKISKHLSGRLKSILSQEKTKISREARHLVGSLLQEDGCTGSVLQFSVEDLRPAAAVPGHRHRQPSDVPFGRQC